MQSNRSRRGFTLAEVLVTLAILATLAAVLLPALMGQLSKGDATRVSNDLIALQTGIGTFASDVKRYPGRVGHLTAAVANSNPDINGTNYPTGLANQWRGPYLTRETIGSLPTADSLRTGFGGTIDGQLLKQGYNGISYVTIQIRNLGEAFDEVDRLIDETASSSTGRLVISGTVTTGTALYYAVPIQ